MYDLKLIDKVINSLKFKFPYTAREWIDSNFVMENYHSHTDFSNTCTTDSPTSYNDYAKRILELGGKCLYSGEHGSQGNQFEAYNVAEKNNLKYVHSTEAYWVKNRLEKDNTNCHICIIGLDLEARKEINYILSMANIDGYYYKPRIDLELLFSLPKDKVIITSACIAGWGYEDSEEIWIKIAKHFGDNFYFEVQPHNTEPQKKLNKKIIELSSKYNIPIIAGLDSHYIDEKGSTKRDQILAYKDIHYEDEEGWYMDYPDGKIVFERFVNQGILTKEQILTAMANTHIFSVCCEKICFDRHFKIPCLYKDLTYEERVGVLKEHLNNAYRKENLKSKEKIEGIRYETEQIVDSGVVDYFLTNEKLIDVAVNEEGGILTTTSRGSSASFIVNKLLGFTTIDRFNSEIPIYPERFLTKERVNAGQMPDIDFNCASQEPFVNAAKKLLGEHSCYPLMAIEKLKEKSAWKLYAGSLKGTKDEIDFQTANAISTYIDQYEDALKYAEEDEKDLIKVEDFIPNEFLDTYKKSLEYQGITIKLKVHACAFMLFDGDIRREIGLTSAISTVTNKRTLVACVEGGYLDEFGYVKDDFLIVDVVGLIDECFSAINKPVPTFDQLREMIKEDNDTWDIYKNGITCCVNQIEKKSTAEKAMKYEPKNLAELSAFIAGIRPGFASLLPKFVKREEYSTGENKIDDLLKDSYHYMIYQESIMKVLSFLGLEMGETYKVIKSISKKKLKGEAKQKLKDKLKPAWEKDFGNLNNFDKVWQVIEDSARYSFNAPHALSMAGDSTYIAWFKAHHTPVFYEVAINHYQEKNKKGKIKDLIREITTYYGYRIGDYKFRNDNRKVNINPDNKIIYPNMSSLKGIQSIASDILWDLKDIKCEDGVDLISILSEYKNEKGDKLNVQSIEKLIKIDYFSEFGDINYLLKTYDLYNRKKYGTCKTFKKKIAEENNWDLEGCYGSETKSMFKEIDNKKLVRRLLEYEKIEPNNIYDKIAYQIDILGYTDIISNEEPLNYFAVQSIEINKWGTPFINLYRIHDGVSAQYKVNKTWFSEMKCKEGDVIKCIFKSKPKRKSIIDPETNKKKWIDTGESESILETYSWVNRI